MDLFELSLGWQEKAILRLNITMRAKGLLGIRTRVDESHITTFVVSFKRGKNVLELAKLNQIKFVLILKHNLRPECKYAAPIIEYPRTATGLCDF